VVEREKAEIGIFITLKEPTRPMVGEAVAVGYYQPEQLNGLKYFRLQILTIADLLRGKQLQFPKFATATFKKAPRQRKGPEPEDTQGNLL
jgi:site-specific DNA-methyltransferase (adenine-specific)